MKGNKLDNIGDVLIVDVKPKISGEVTFTDFSDELVGVAVNRNVRREFRVLSGGIFWSDWNELNNTNLPKATYTPDSTFTVQVKYTRIGNDTSGSIEFLSIHFLGTSSEIIASTPTIDSSVFSNIIKTPELRHLQSNLFKKLYYRGIVPKYVTRGDNNEEEEDKGYIVLFNSIARFFALFIRLFKRFENFRNDFELMREQVRQSGLYFDESEITLEKLQYLASHLYDETRKRGTEMIFKREGTPISIGNQREVEVDGELLRLLRNGNNDELVYENIPIHKMGWVLGQSSPMYKGTSMSGELNKVKGTNELCVADPKIDYEITFSFKVNNKTTGGDIIFSVKGYDGLRNHLNDSFILPNGEIVSEQFFNIPSSNLVVGHWYNARGIIHAYSSSASIESKTNMGVGTNLYFNNPFVKFILPSVEAGSGVTVKDYEIRPLVRGANIVPLKNGKENAHSLGFLQSSRVFYCYALNNNNSQSKEEIISIIEKYLMPYNITNMFVLI